MPATWLLPEIQNLFGEFGNLENTLISRGSEDDNAVIEFKSFTDAELAKKHLNDAIIHGKKLSVVDYFSLDQNFQS
jgi:RNA recognition motif-containing protein